MKYSDWTGRAKQHHGLRPSQGRWCLSQLAGKPACCTRYGNCSCVPQFFLDHKGRWLRGWYPDRQTVLTSEPYGMTLEKAVELVELSDALDLHVTIGGKSMWMPGHTTLIMWEKL